MTPQDDDVDTLLDALRLIRLIQQMVDAEYATLVNARALTDGERAARNAGDET